jgi:hypothetical protein
MTEIAQIVQKIKQKKELSGIEDSIVLEHLNEYLAKHRINLTALTPYQIKLIITDIRKILREKVGRFQASTKSRYPLLEKGDIQAVLRTHSSTKERVGFYPQLKEIIKRLKVKSILDLGCGINPLALAEKGTKYYASDINAEDLNIVREYFRNYKIDGEVFVCDLNRIDECEFPKADLTLVLKVFDILGKSDYRTAKNILEKISSKHLIVSFSTRTLSGKPMKNQRRIWFERLLDSLLYKSEIIKSENEIFYIV